MAMSDKYRELKKLLDIFKKDKMKEETKRIMIMIDYQVLKNKQMKNGKELYKAKTVFLILISKETPINHCSMTQTY